MPVLSVERTSDAVVIRLPLDSSADYIQNMLEYFTYVQLGSQSAVSQETIDELAEQSKAGWWQANRKRFKGLLPDEGLSE